MLARILPLVGIVLFLGVGVVWRSWLQYRRHGHAGIILFRSHETRQRIHDAMFVLVLLVLTVQTMTFALSPLALAGIYVVPPLSGNGAIAIGSLLVFGGVAFMVLAQLHLGASWRIGIDEGARPGLVTVGLYRFCRNPIFLGMFVCLAGFAVLVPTWLSIAVLLGTILGVRRQVLEEEAYLLRTYGADYRAYARRVGRFVPGLGGLS
jgi:protein-S-isoprenylcysteine O-methyltransferase Ste14